MGQIGSTTFRYFHRHMTEADTLLRINDLIQEAKRTPFARIGKPEPLIGNLASCWSRRITGTLRLVCRVSSSADQAQEVLQCRGHDG